MTLEEIERELRAAIEAAIGDGWALGQGCMFPKDRTCCALGALVRNDTHATDNDAFYAAVRRLGISSDNATSIARGFDDLHCYEDADRKYHQLGARLAADYVK